MEVQSHLYEAKTSNRIEIAITVYRRFSGYGEIRFVPGIFPIERFSQSKNILRRRWNNQKTAPDCTRDRWRFWSTLINESHNTIYMMVSNYVHNWKWSWSCGFYSSYANQGGRSY